MINIIKHTLSKSAQCRVSVWDIGQYLVNVCLIFHTRNQAMNDLYVELLLHEIWTVDNLYFINLLNFKRRCHNKICYIAQNQKTVSADL